MRYLHQGLSGSMPVATVNRLVGNIGMSVCWLDTELTKLRYVLSPGGMFMIGIGMMLHMSRTSTHDDVHDSSLCVFVYGSQCGTCFRELAWPYISIV